MAPMAEIAHPLVRSVLRGLKGACPACGQGAMFWKYLKVCGHCDRCGHDLARYPADDGPAYLTILLVGHLIVAPLLFFPIVWEAPPAFTLPIVMAPLALLTLLILPRVKGGWIGLMYALGAKDTDAHMHAADRAD